MKKLISKTILVGILCISSSIYANESNNNKIDLTNENQIEKTDIDNTENEVQVNHEITSAEEKLLELQKKQNKDLILDENTDDKLEEKNQEEDQEDAETNENTDKI